MKSIQASGLEIGGERRYALFLISGWRLWHFAGKSSTKRRIRDERILRWRSGP
jgi:hypothetical protein